MQRTDRNCHRSGRSLVVVVLAVVVLLAAGIGVFLSLRREAVLPPKPGGDERSADASLSQADCARLRELHNRAVGALENERFADAGRDLGELAQRLPNDPIVCRNLLIAMILSQGTTSAVGGDADRLITRLKELEPDSHVPHVLASRWARATKNQALGLTELARAVEKADSDLPTLYEFYEESKAAAEPRVVEEGRSALKRAYERHPDNLYVLTEWMTAQAAAQDTAIAESLKAARDQIKPILETVVAGPQRAAPEYLDKAADFVSRGEWRQVAQHVAFFRNVIRPTEWVQSDLRRTQRHALAYVLTDFRVAGCSLEDSREAAPPPIEIRFTRAPSSQQPPAVPSVSAVHLCDFDLDGRLELVALAAEKLIVFSRSSAGEWRSIIEAPVPSELGKFLVADLDRDQPRGPGAPAPRPADSPDAAAKPNATTDANSPCQDADLDVVAFGAAGVRVLRNDMQQDGSRQLTPVAQEPAFDELRDVLAGVLGDFDHDGDLDLLVSSSRGISIWLNRGDLRFYDVTGQSTIPAQPWSTALIAVDWNRDLALDVVVSGVVGEPAGYLENLRHGQFRWRPFAGPLAEISSSHSLVLLDHDANGSWDLIGSGDAGTKLVTTRFDSGTVNGIEATTISDGSSSALLSLDFDNDSLTDLFSLPKDRPALHRATPDGKYAVSTELIAVPPGNINACASGDIDADGDIDLVFATFESLTVLSNEGGNGNHWLDLRIRARPDHTSGRVNHLGIGSVAELKAGALYREQLITGQVAHFGLGKRDQVDLVRILWTNGVPQNAFPQQTNLSVCEEQFPTGSCPFLYTWTGAKFEFFTDLLWNAPLGLQLAEGVVARPREWEYLLIPGERLVPRHSRYVLQITEELWEAGYFDRVRLIAVDHPADVAVYTNEKVGPAALAEFKVHTVREPHRPVAARDSAGRDVLDRISRRDGIYVKGFPGPSRRGYVGEHYLELDLGHWNNPGKMTLFLTGWLYPTPTSVNIGISQNAEFGQPRPPALWVPDASGTWKEIRPFMGFPGGKTKTIAIDLSGVFKAADYRLRIATSQEFYWDEAFVTVDEAPAPTRLTKLDPVSADLHYRGFSARRPVPDFGPDIYDYADCSRIPAWKSMSGLFTRYGDVAELLAQEDDRLVVLGAGDELTIEFPVPPDDPPAGWKRDFLLYNVGWDKDADLNVIYGQSSEPLPFRGMSGYPYRGDESFPDTPMHREYLQTYQTRTLPQAGFWSHVRAAGRSDETSRP